MAEIINNGKIEFQILCFDFSMIVSSTSFLFKILSIFWWTSKIFFKYQPKIIVFTWTCCFQLFTTRSQAISSKINQSFDNGYFVVFTSFIFLKVA